VIRLLLLAVALEQKPYRGNVPSSGPIAQDPDQLVLVRQLCSLLRSEGGLDNELTQQLGALEPATRRQGV
jgi:hypothetical protein